MNLVVETYVNAFYFLPSLSVEHDNDEGSWRVAFCFLFFGFALEWPENHS